MTIFGLRSVLFLDLDKTIRYNKNAPDDFIRSPDDVAIYEDVIPRLEAYLNEAEGDILSVGITNQGGVAFGYATEAEVQAIHARTQELLGDMKLFGIVSCYFHPRATKEEYRCASFSRKPNPGMLALAERQINNAGYRLDWANSLMVGDGDEDAECAKRGGLSFQWAWSFFGRPRP